LRDLLIFFTVVLLKKVRTESIFWLKVEKKNGGVFFVFWSSWLLRYLATKN